MDILQEFLLWTSAFVAQYGLFGAFIISVLESFIFPIPTAAFITPFTVLGMDPLVITLVTATGSIIGALIGYYLGMKLGKPVAYRYFAKYMPRVERFFEKYGAWAVFIAAFTPVPFKVFTWASGIVRLKLWKFLAAAIPGRVLQFAIAAYVGDFIGPWLLSLVGL